MKAVVIYEASFGSTYAIADAIGFPCCTNSTRICAQLFRAAAACWLGAFGRIASAKPAPAAVAYGRGHESYCRRLSF